MASLCMAAGALAAAPAQAAYTTTIDCSDSSVTRGNPGYSNCSGPVGPDPVTNLGGLLTGSQSELDALTNTFGVDPAVGTTIPFKYLGKSNDLPDNGPFTSNPGTPSGVLTFDPTISMLGTFFVLGFESESLNNYSYYLFDSRAFRTLSVAFDTRGITKGDGSQDQLAGVPIGPNLAFAGLYVQVLPTGGAVPEPTGIALIAAAFGALALTTRRRRG